MENKVNNIIFDRNLIDALCYLDMYYPHLKWDINLLSDHLNELCEQNNIKYIHKTSVLITHPTKEEHIKKIIEDPIRKYNSSVKSYMEDAKKWEEKFLDYNDKLEMICENFMVIGAYPEEKEGFKKKGRKEEKPKKCKERNEKKKQIKKKLKFLSNCKYDGSCCECFRGYVCINKTQLECFLR